MSKITLKDLSHSYLDVQNKDEDWNGRLLKDEEWVLSLNKYAQRPDLWIFIDTSPDIALQRRLKRDLKADLYEKSTWQEDIYKSYCKLFDSEKGLKLRLDGSLAPERLVELALDFIMNTEIFSGAENE